jgi:hypothetical protein
MNFVALVYNGHSYCYNGGNDLAIAILGCFLSSDVGCTLSENGLLLSSFGRWALEEGWRGASGNITMVEKENDYIYLSDLYSEERKPTELKMMVQQFVQLLDDWREKVCKRKPKEVTITYDGNQFTIETSDV